MRGNLTVQICKADREIQDQRPEPHHLPLWVDTEAPTKVEQHHQSRMNAEQQCRGRPTCDYGGQSHKHLTRTSSAAASESARGGGLNGSSHVKLSSTTARRRLQRLVRCLRCWHPAVLRVIPYALAKCFGAVAD